MTILCCFPTNNPTTIPFILLILLLIQQHRNWQRHILENKQKRIHHNCHHLHCCRHCLCYCHCHLWHHYHHQLQQRTDGTMHPPNRPLQTYQSQYQCQCQGNLAQRCRMWAATNCPFCPLELYPQKFYVSLKMCAIHFSKLRIGCYRISKTNCSQHTHLKSPETKTIDWKSWRKQPESSSSKETM